MANGFVAYGILDILFSFGPSKQFFDVFLALLDLASFLLDSLEVACDLTKGQIWSLIVLLDCYGTQKTFLLSVFDQKSKVVLDGYRLRSQLEIAWFWGDQAFFAKFVLSRLIKRI